MSSMFSALDQIDVSRDKDVFMDRIDWISVKKLATAAIFIVVAAWITWHGRTFNPEKMGLTTPLMCGFAGFAFLFTGYRMVLGDED